MQTARRQLRRFLRSEDGPTTTEYAVLLAVIVITAVTAMGGFGVKMGNIYTSISATAGAATAS